MEIGFEVKPLHALEATVPLKVFIFFFHLGKYLNRMYTTYITLLPEFQSIHAKHRIEILPFMLHESDKRDYGI